MRLLNPELHIRTRIAVWITAISSLLLIFMALSVYGVFQQQLLASLDDTLRLRATANRQLVNLAIDPPSLQVIRAPDRELVAGEAVLRLYRADGTLVDDASPATGLTGEERAVVLAAATTGTDVYRTIDLADDEDYRVVASPIGEPGPDQVVLVTGLERSRVNSPLRILRIILAIAVPVTAGGAGLGGFWVAQRALTPVAAMAATARRITHGDLTQRVPGAASGDELGQLATTLNAMIERLSDTVERERRFTADAAHELRTPLAAIETGIDVTLAHERSADEYRHLLALVRTQTRRLDRLANQLLLLSRLDAEVVQRTFAPVELNGLLDAVAESFRDNHQRATVNANIPSDEISIDGDVELLARMVMNLLENAARHAGETVTISLHLRRDSQQATIVVVDNGPGIPPELAEDIFRRFGRGDASRTGAGTGLGLSIVEAIAICHGGDVRLAPTGTSNGARFDITLPITSVVGHTPPTR